MKIEMDRGRTGKKLYQIWNHSFLKMRYEPSGLIGKDSVSNIDPSLINFVNLQEELLSFTQVDWYETR